MIRTDAGSVFHTADWKIDATPMTGKAFKPRVFQRLALENVTAMVCDSTNALREGFSVSENDCYQALLQVIAEAQGRVVVTGFSSNVGRLIALGRVANKTGRYMALLGRSLQNMVGAARATGHWPEDIHLIDANDLGYLPKAEVLVVATGSQGEPKATLSRLAADMQRELSLDSGDLVIFSSIIIPGNEAFIEKLVQQFQQRDIQTLQSHNTELPIHVSGHPCRGELELLYSWVKPQIAVPVHGEAAHIAANADVARQSQVPVQLTGLNGDLYVLSPQPRIYKQVVNTGRIALVRS
jgi:ribonuclease J